MPTGRKVNSFYATSAALTLAISAARVSAEPNTAAHIDTNQSRTLERVNVTGARPSTLPLDIPTTTEGITGAQIERAINATDASDALKYFPSLVVRKRNVGDYDHAVLATRASGTGNSARSLVFADGILLSNLLGNGAEFTPRWGLVAADEIERVDVLYGPFSAAYSGNSAGAVVDYVTRMPTQFEAHLKLQAFTQTYRQFATDDRYSGHQTSASLGSRSGGLSWWLHLNHLDSDSQPLVFARVNRVTVSGAAGKPVGGAVAGRNQLGADVWNVGSSAQTDSMQDHAKLKLAYDLTPALRVSYTFGVWRNDAQRSADTYLRDADGNAVYSGAVRIGGSSYTLPGLVPTRSRMQHVAHGLTVKSNTREGWDWDVTASRYDYRDDRVRAPVAATVLPAALTGGAGRTVSLRGTGWNSLAAKGIWRPDGMDGAHRVEFGLQREAYTLRRRESDTADWIGGDAVSLAAAFAGQTKLTSVWAQDAWHLAPQWRAVLGGRYEAWAARDGRRTVAAVSTAYGNRDAAAVSPKAAVWFDTDGDWTLKASIGRAVRNPTVSELFQGGIHTTTGLPTFNDPNLRSEKSVTTELTAERALPHGVLRSTLFIERLHDALYSQPAVGGTRVQNVGRIDTRGVELAVQVQRLLVPGLEFTGSVTYADSEIKKNDGFPDTIGKRQPRVPDWRGNVLASYTADARWSGSLGARFSGKQFGQLNNADTNASTYFGFSRYFVADARLQYRVDRQWLLSVGVDNLNNEKYWAFHQYPQRTFHAELRFDY